MIEARRRAYLEALDIPVWVGRGSGRATAPRGSGRVQMGPGSSALLVVCDDQEAPAAQLANDIARVLAERPVWSWPAAADAGVVFEAALEERPFSHVLILGEKLAQSLMGPSPPERTGQSRLLVADDLATLAAEPAARRRLWQRLCRAGMVKVQ